jgi:hypothetical protein
MFAPVAYPPIYSRLVPARLRALSPTPTVWFVLRWLLLASLVGALAGTASAGFLGSVNSRVARVRLLQVGQRPKNAYPTYLTASRRDETA